MISRKSQLLFLLLLLPFMSTQAQWKSDPSLNNVICQEGSNQNAPRIISDGRNGAIICWHDQRSGSEFDIYAQRIDADGYVRWTVNGNGVSTALHSQSKPDMVSDGEGGAIIAWTDTRNGDNDIYAQRVDSSGNMLWTKDGVRITFDTTNQSDPKIASDGSGGIIITWNGATGGWPPTSRIYAQRLDADGNILWNSDALLSGSLRFSNAPCIASDGNGGAYVAWAYFPRPEYDVYAQHVDENGALLWAGNGEAIANGSGNQDSPFLTSDADGNALLAYTDWGGGSTPVLYAVTLDANGPTSSQRVVSTSGGQSYQHAAALGDDMFGLTWSDGRGATEAVYAQMIDRDGNKIWTADGVRLSGRSGAQVTPFVIPDGDGGMIVAWEDKTRGALNSDIYAQRLSPDGLQQWEDAGAPVCIADNGKQFPQMISDGANGAIAAWEDYRPSFSNSEIYASRILADGSFPEEPPILRLSDNTISFGSVVVNKSATKTITLSNIGGEDVSIASVTSDDPQFSMAAASSTIAPGADVSAELRFEPTAKGSFNARITIESNSVTSPDVITLTGEALAFPGIETDHPALAFGQVNVGSTKVIALTISNPGSDTLSITDISPSSSDFTVDIASQILPPGASFVDSVRFSPPNEGSFSGQLTITSNAPTSPTTLPLSGTGVSAGGLGIDLAAISFGNVPVGSYRDTTVTLTNNGNETLTITSFTAGDPSFTLESQISDIPPAGSADFILRFSPMAEGPVSAAFSIESNASSSPDAIPVDGNGVMGAEITFVPAQLSFGSVEVGVEKSLALTISNPGAQTLMVVSVTSTSGEFTADEEQFEVPSGASYTDSIRFAPSAIGPVSGFLIVESNAITSPDTILIDGTGTEASAVNELRAFPGVFTLYQNYPNPFSPSTTIRYNLEASAPVRLTIYNVIGQAVVTLVDAPQQRGLHTVRWTTSGSKPGVYFYVLRVGSHEAFGRMLLMK
ncbi:choice-of-anchor D domain-containing protein [bacterium]|nr:choice-of-anchor D domain-containing protein [bacterium]